MHFAEVIVPRMDALCKVNQSWASAFSNAAQDNSWLLGVTTATNEMYTVLGQHFHKFLIEAGVMADWVHQSGAVLTRAAQFFPQLDVRYC